MLRLLAIKSNQFGTTYFRFYDCARIHKIIYHKSTPSQIGAPSNRKLTSPTTRAHFLKGFFDERPSSCIANLEKRDTTEKTTKPQRHYKTCYQYSVATKISTVDTKVHQGKGQRKSTSPTSYEGAECNAVLTKYVGEQVSSHLDNPGVPAPQ